MVKIIEIRNSSLTSVVGSVTCGSAMPGLSLVTSAAGAALENMPAQPWTTLDMVRSVLLGAGQKAEQEGEEVGVSRPG